MSVVLKGNTRSELPLITFTTLIPGAEGVALCALVVGGGVVCAAVAWIMASIGALASIAHLAKPFRAMRSLSNLKSSWLSREIAVTAIFWVVLTGWVVACICGSFAIAIGLNAFAALVGIPLLAVMAQAYRISTRPAWCGSEGLAEQWAGALGIGSATVLLITACEALRDTFSFLPSLSSLTAGLLLAASAGALVIDIVSHQLRKKRLVALAPQSDERIPLTLAHYEQLWPRVRRLWGIESACFGIQVAALAMMMVSMTGVAIVLLAIACIGEFFVHAQHRAIFYELPVQVRWVAQLRK